MKDVVAFFLCLMAALCAECIPLLLLLTVAAVVASFWPERRRHRRREGRHIDTSVLYSMKSPRVGGDKEDKTA